MNAGGRLERLAHGAIDVGTDVVRARVPTMRENEWIRRVLPEPDPPMKPPAGKGSAAAHVPDYDDPGYLKACAEWNKRGCLLELAIAIAMEVNVDGGSVSYDPRWASSDSVDPTGKNWALAAIDELLDTISRGSFDRAIAQLRDLEGSLVRRAYCQVYGFDEVDLTPREEELLRVNVGAGANTLEIAMDLGKEYGQGDPIAWWDGMSSQNRAAIVARRVREIIDREEAEARA